MSTNWKRAYLGVLSVNMMHPKYTANPYHIYKWCSNLYSTCSCISFHFECDRSIFFWVSSSWDEYPPFSSAISFAIRFFSLIALISARCFSILSQSLSHLLLSALMSLLSFSCGSYMLSHTVIWFKYHRTKREKPTVNVNQRERERERENWKICTFHWLWDFSIFSNVSSSVSTIPIDCK